MNGIRFFSRNRIVVAICTSFLLEATGCAQAKGPVPIAWDKETCAECHMHIGDPRFAAQLQTKKRETLNFDDVGCLLQYRARHAALVHALWFRNSRADAWLSQTNVRFVRSEVRTPMGYGFAAVDASLPDALTLDQVQKQAPPSTNHERAP